MSITNNPQVKTGNGKVLFPVQAFREFVRNIRKAFGRANAWRSSATETVQDVLIDARDWEKENWLALVIVSSIILWLGLMIWFFVDLSGGRVAGNHLQIGVGGVIGGAILGLLASLILAFVLLLALFLLDFAFLFLTPVVLFLPIIAWAPFYLLYQSLLVVAKLLLLLPLSVLVVITRIIQLLRGIFFTCPSRICGHRGLPAYVCPQCGVSNAMLWPNMYGLFTHECVNCGKRLPTLGMLGRNKLQPRCSNATCGRPLPGKHEARERLVAFIGGPYSGKTNYLMMAARSVLGGAHLSGQQIEGEVGDPQQNTVFNSGWRLLETGIPVDKTIAVENAYLLNMRFGRQRQHVYLYDAPGEEFESIDNMTKQQYFWLLEGLIVCVDPLTFPAVREQAGVPATTAKTFHDIITSVVHRACAGISPAGLKKLRVAVVITKADLPCIARDLGGDTGAPVSGETCRSAIIRWGGESGLRAIENYFSKIEYFACSALGREASTDNRAPFQARGVLEPLVWILSGKRSREAAVPGRAQAASRPTTERPAQPKQPQPKKPKQTAQPSGKQAQVAQAPAKPAQAAQPSGKPTQSTQTTGKPVQRTQTTAKPAQSPGKPVPAKNPAVTPRVQAPKLGGWKPIGRR